MNIRAVKTGIFKEGEDLLSFVAKYIPKLKDGSVLVVTSKIVALAEGRTAPLADKEKLIRSESEWALRTKYGKVTLKDGILMWNAGIDTSNADGKLVLLPTNSFTAAQKLRSGLLQTYKTRKLGIVVSDSRIMPLRAGVVGIALGYAGFKGIYDYRGKKDIFGDVYQVTRTDIADALATAAVLMMGEGNERQPLAVIENAPVEFVERVDRKELLVPMKDDMYYPLFKRRTP
jgi:coenzyme F420-0:L-glutamate ligase